MGTRAPRPAEHSWATASVIPSRSWLRRLPSIVEACDEIGTAVAREPWLERHPATVLAAPTRHAGRWVLTDDSGALPLLATPHALATVLAATAGEPATLTVEWTPHGVIPLTIHSTDRALDVGPVADPSFVGVA